MTCCNSLATGQSAFISAKHRGATCEREFEFCEQQKRVAINWSDVADFLAACFVETFSSSPIDGSTMVDEPLLDRPGSSSAESDLKPIAESCPI